MNRSDFLIEVEELLELDEGILQGDEILAEFEEWDSLAVISFIALANEHFDIIIKGDDFINAKTVNDLLNLVSEHLTEN